MLSVDVADRSHHVAQLVDNLLCNQAGLHCPRTSYRCHTHGRYCYLAPGIRSARF